MLFWIVAGLVAAAVAALLVRPLLAPAPAEAQVSPDQAIYRDQLAEVDRDLRRGVIAPEEAERARVEIARRLLTADKAGPVRFQEAPRGAAMTLVAVAAGLVVMGSLALYAELGRPGAADQPRAERLAEAQASYEGRPSQAEAEALAAVARVEPPPAPPNVQETIDRLREAAEAGTADAQGLEFLAFVEQQLNDLPAAARAQERLIALKGEAATAEDRARLLAMMVGAAGGIVTPEAEELLVTLREADPQMPAVLYYSGLLLGTTGRPDLAFDYWRALVERAPADDPYRTLALPSMGDLAYLAGRDFTPPPASAPGPSAEDMEAAAEMSPEDREAMIRSMVEGLSERLATEGGPVEDWARLISSLGVLGDRERAAAILAEARGTFAESADAQRLLDDAARSAGIAE
jgi:cytochrome c-type biogenesis protein CcmH